MALLLRRPYLRLTMALVWVLLTERFTPGNLLSGFLLATFTLAIFPAPVVQLHRLSWGGPIGFIRWIGAIIRLLAFFLYEMILANLQVSRIVLSKEFALRSGIIAMPLRVRSQGQVAMLAALITLTPGTVSIDTSRRDDVLFIHTINASDMEETLRVPRRFEDLILEVIP
jgi:multicomponent Na+:H+ antiporter subunit E